MNYIIITGASKGLGEALTQKLMNKDNHLICISRSKNNTLIEEAAKNDVKLDYIEYDLNDTNGAEALAEKIFSNIDTTNAKAIYMINNAGVVDPIKLVEKVETNEIQKSVNVNLISPMVLTIAFLRKTNDLKIEKRIINISSAAAKSPYPGWGCYCTSKAALDMFTQCVGAEQNELEFPTKILSFAPGVVDTEMQVQIRSSKKEDFPLINTFVGLKEKGRLLQPAYVAEKVTDILFAEDFKNGGILDIYKL